MARRPAATSGAPWTTSRRERDRPPRRDRFGRAAGGRSGACAGGRAPRQATGLFHTALRFESRADLAAALRRLIGERVPVTGASDHGVSEAIYLDDPDGNGVELYWDRPRDDWPAPEPGERVHMFTAPLDLEGLLGEGPAEERPRDVGHVHLKVADIAAAVRFWGDVLGFDLMTTFGGQAAFLSAGGYHHHVGANTWMSAGAGPGPAERPGLEAVTLAFPDRPALDAVLERLESAGAAMEPIETGVAARDQDGNRVVLALSPAP
ncbi:MAG: VOC family protein [Solirubrobacteraceae bacterium]